MIVAVINPLLWQKSIAIILNWPIANTADIHTSPTRPLVKIEVHDSEATVPPISNSAQRFGGTKYYCMSGTGSIRHRKRLCPSYLSQLDTVAHSRKNAEHALVDSSSMHSRSTRRFCLVLHWLAVPLPLLVTFMRKRSLQTIHTSVPQPGWEMDVRTDSFGKKIVECPPRKGRCWVWQFVRQE